jgi:hypothetical protein
MKMIRIKYININNPATGNGGMRSLPMYQISKKFN